MLGINKRVSKEEYVRYSKLMRARRSKYASKVHTLGVYNYGDVAEAAGVSRRTLNRRIKTRDTPYKKSYILRT